MKSVMLKVFIFILGSSIAIVVILCGQGYLEQKVYCSARLKQSIGVEQLTTAALEHFTVWEEKKGAVFFSPMLDQSCTGECVYIAGELEKLQEWDMIDGTLFLDDKSVIITNVAAQQLFHSEYAVGQQLQYGENCYYVRGVVAGERGKVYLEAAIPGENGYIWVTSINDKNKTLTHVSYTVKRKECLLKGISEMLQFQLEKNGYPQIDMIL